MSRLELFCHGSKMAEVIKEDEVNKEHFQKGQMAKSKSWLRKGKKQ